MKSVDPAHTVIGPILDAIAPSGDCSWGRHVARRSDRGPVEPALQADSFAVAPLDTLGSRLKRDNVCFKEKKIVAVITF